jgi:hypothetical protein
LFRLLCQGPGAEKNRQGSKQQIAPFSVVGCRLPALQHYDLRPNHTSQYDCQACPMKSQCCPNGLHRRIGRNPFEPARDGCHFSAGDCPPTAHPETYRRIRSTRITLTLNGDVWPTRLSWLSLFRVPCAASYHCHGSLIGFHFPNIAVRRKARHNS